MKLLVFIGLCALILPHSASAGFDGAVLDINSFKRAASHALQVYGHQPIDIVFQDAAHATDQEVIHDGAMVFAMGRGTNIASVFGKYRLAYRLRLNTGQTDVVLVRYTDEGSRTIVLPHAMTVIFEESVSNHEFLQAAKSLEILTANMANVTTAANLKRVVLELNEPGIVPFMMLYEIVANSQKIKLSRKIGYSYENYTRPYTQGTPLLLNYEESLDLDRIRDVLPALLKEGKKITSDHSFLPTFLRYTPSLIPFCHKVFKSM